jgi:hypothetical protein
MGPNAIGLNKPSNVIAAEEPGTSASEAKGNSASEVFHASSQNPVKEVPLEDVGKVIDSFNESLQSFGTSGSSSPEDPVWKGNINAARSVAMDIKKEVAGSDSGSVSVSNSESVSNSDSENSGNSSYEVLKYDVGGGHTAAVMGLWHSEDGVTTVHSLAAHPGTSGGGSTMIEEATNRSRNGKLSVESRPQTEPFYSSVGFKRDSRQKNEDDAVSMHLDPSRSDKWSREGGRWKLRGQESKKYMVLQENSGTSVSSANPENLPAGSRAASLESDAGSIESSVDSDPRDRKRPKISSTP